MDAWAANGAPVKDRVAIQIAAMRERFTRVACMLHLHLGRDRSTYHGTRERCDNRNRKEGSTVVSGLTSFLFLIFYARHKRSSAISRWRVAAPMISLRT